MQISGTEKEFLLNKKDGLLRFNLMLLPPQVPRIFSAWVEGFLSNIFSLSFAHDLRRIISALFPATFISQQVQVIRCPRSGLAAPRLLGGLPIPRGQPRKLRVQSAAVFSEGDPSSKCGSYAPLLLLESSHDVPERGVVEHGESIVEESIQRQHDLSESGGSYDVNPAIPSPRRRGRPKKFMSAKGTGQSSSSADNEESAPLVCEGGPSGGYFTRAKKTWLLGKVLGLKFPGSDLEAIRGLEEEFKSFYSV
jgi:hypothetical protein